MKSSDRLSPQLKLAPLAAAFTAIMTLAGCASAPRSGPDWREARVQEVVVRPDGRRVARVSHYHGGTVLRAERTVPDGLSVGPGERVWFDHNRPDGPLSIQAPAPSQR